MKIWLRTLIAALFLAGIVTIAIAAEKKHKPTQLVSLVQLIASPEKYHNKRVYVSGFYHSDMEHSALYLSRDDAEFMIIQNSVWIGDWAKNANPDLVKITNNTFVKIEGTFQYFKKGGGHMNCWSGEINDITLFVSARSLFRSETK